MCTMFMHHNAFELGVDTHNSAVTLCNQFAALLRGEQLDAEPPSFVGECVQELESLVGEWGMNLSADGEELALIVRERILSPMIGQPLFAGAIVPTSEHRAGSRAAL